MQIAAFGEVLWDVYPDDRFIGGAPFNFAGHSAAHGDTVTLITAVGNDPLGRDTVKKIAAHGILTDAINLRPNAPTGVCRVTLDQNGIPSYHLEDHTAWDEIEPPSAPVSADLLYFGTLALRSDRNRRALEAILRHSAAPHRLADVNIRPPFYSKDSILFCLENATIVKISEEELPLVLEQLDMDNDGDVKSICLRLAVRFDNLDVILITCGDRGATVFDTRQHVYHAVPAVPVTVCSTVGAGDSFAAAFCHRYLQGDSLDKCLMHATVVAAFVVSEKEAIPPYPPSFTL